HGGGLADLCGTGTGEKHHCPFCHALPGLPQVTPVETEFLLVPHDGWRLGADLHRSAQARNINHSPRAPPTQT
ncbi:hypothetical protein AB9K41_01235, partial [Cribrihabitans sp. XS_ASV171]